VGLLQFGLKPYPGSLLGKIQPEPVLSLHARVTLLKDLPAGTPISYGKTFTLEKPTRIAVLALGYADGLGTAASNRAQGLIGGQRCPVLGRVTMDQTIVDVSHVEPPVRVGDGVVLIGHQGREAIDVLEYSSW